MKFSFQARLFVLLCVVFKFYSVTYFIYAPVVKFKSALIKAKILRLIWWIYLNRFEIFALRQTICLVLGRNLLQNI